MTAKRSMGWLPDYPDFRDYTEETQEVMRLVDPDGIGKNANRTIPGAKRRGTKTTADKLPASVDLRPWCSPVEDQGMLGSCTANAGVGIIEYYERKASAGIPTPRGSSFIKSHATS